MQEKPINLFLDYIKWSGRVSLFSIIYFFNLVLNIAALQGVHYPGKTWETWKTWDLRFLGPKTWDSQFLGPKTWENLGFEDFCLLFLTKMGKFVKVWKVCLEVATHVLAFIFCL